MDKKTTAWPRGWFFQIEVLYQMWRSYYHYDSFVGCAAILSQVNGFNNSYSIVLDIMKSKTSTPFFIAFINCLQSKEHDRLALLLRFCIVAEIPHIIDQAPEYFFGDWSQLSSRHLRVEKWGCTVVPYNFFRGYGKKPCIYEEKLRSMCCV